jgi:bilin biosynthesis protein
VLVSELSAASAYRRLEAVKALGKINHVDIIMPLFSALKDSDPDVRAAASNTLMIIHVPPTAIESLIELSNDRNANVRSSATTVLCNAGPSAVEPLVAYLNDERENVRKCAIRALGAIGDQQAVDPLRAALNDQSLWVRKEAEVALKKLGEIGQA